LFRHLLSVNASGLNESWPAANETLFPGNDSLVSGTRNVTTLASNPAPLFPPNLFTPEQLKQVKRVHIIPRLKCNFEQF
jgi:hypothetical protein